MSDPALYLGATCLSLILLKLRSQFGLGNVDLSHQILNAEFHIIHSDLLFLSELRLIIFVVFTNFRLRDVDLIRYIVRAQHYVPKVSGLIAKGNHLFQFCRRYETTTSDAAG